MRDRGWVYIGDEQPEPERWVLLAEDTKGRAWPGRRTVCRCNDRSEEDKARHATCLDCEKYAEDGTWYRWAGGDQDPPAYPTHWMPLPKTPWETVNAGLSAEGEGERP